MPRSHASWYKSRRPIGKYGEANKKDFYLLFPGRLVITIACSMHSFVGAACDGLEGARIDLFVIVAMESMVFPTINKLIAKSKH